jgi:hypothetical protein
VTVTAKDGSRRPAAVLALVVIDLILAFGGLISGQALIRDPSGNGVGLSPDLLKGTPVGDYTLVGVFLTTVLGIVPIVIAYGLVTRVRWSWTDPLNSWIHQLWSWTASLILGIVLILWIAIETILIGYESFLQPTIALLGALVICLSMLPSVRRHLSL